MSETRRDQCAIAITGMAGRFPGAANIEQLWTLLQGGREGLSAANHAWPHRTGTQRYIEVGGYLQDIDLFDPEFFGYSPAQATELDPQQRLFLECSWEALEDAGYSPERYGSSVGVFAASGPTRYGLAEAARELGLRKTIDLMQRTLNTDRDYLATRVAYKMDLRGPAITVQTACSSSLVAVHMACQSLICGQCDAALVGGVNIHLPHQQGYLYQEGGILSVDGHCRPFDAECSGTVPGSGAGVVVLRPLGDALAARDRIYAVIIGSAINNDGAGKVSFTAPSVDGQIEALENSLGKICPDTVGMIEAHGTGTVMGDAIELTALAEVFRRHTRRSRFCALGSIKANIGHLDAAAGIAGLIKAALCLSKRRHVPALNVRRRSSLLDDESSPFYLNPTACRWESIRLRRAGISSFGMGGTNAHVVMEEAPAIDHIVPPPSHSTILLTAKSPRALRQVRERLAAALNNCAEPPIEDVAYTLQSGRLHFTHRQAISVSGNTKDLVATLIVDNTPSVVVSTAPTVIPLFGDFTLEDLDCSANLYKAEPQWRTEFDRCADIANPILKYDLTKQLTCSKRSTLSVGEDLVLKLASQVCTGTLLSKWCSPPPILIGMGIGELTAACLARRIPFEDAVRILLGAFGDKCPTMPLSLSISDAGTSISCVSLESGGPLDEAELASPLFWKTRALAKSDHYERAHDLIPPEHLLLPCATAALRAWCERGPRSENAHEAPHLLNIAANCLWLRGVAIDWPSALGNENATITALPPYPFERRSFWLDTGKVEASTDDTQSSHPLRLYVPSWCPTLPPHAVDKAQIKAAGGQWVIITDGDPLGESLIDYLAQAGVSVIVLHTRPSGVERPGRFELDIYDWGGLRATLERHLAPLGNAVRIIQLVTPTTDPAKTASLGNVPADPVTDFWAAQRAGMLLSLEVLQSLAIDSGRRSVTITWLTRQIASDLHRINHPGVQTITALARIMTQELPQLTGRVVDLADPIEGESTAWILAETLLPRSDVQVAYRSGLRFVQTFVELDEPPEEEVVGVLRDRGVYLITGGLGTLGLELAEALARRQRVRLLLASRPPADAATQDEISNDTVSHRRNAIASIEALGSEARVLEVDVSAADRLGKLVAESEELWGPISGVFHLAGALKDSSIQVPIFRLRAEHLQRQCRPKFEGAVALERVFADRTLDFAVMFSSTSSILGGAGLCAYAASNAALDALAFGNRRCGSTRWTSINWDGWLRDGATRLNFNDVFPPEGIGAMLRAIGSRVRSQIVVSREPFATRLRTIGHFCASVGREHKAIGRRAESLGAYSPPVTDLERLIAGFWQDTLGVDQVGLRDDFFLLGGDSLVLMGITERISEELGVELPLRELLRDGLTVEAVVRDVVAKLTKSRLGITDHDESIPVSGPCGRSESGPMTGEAN